MRKDYNWKGRGRGGGVAIAALLLVDDKWRSIYGAGMGSFRKKIHHFLGLSTILRQSCDRFWANIGYFLAVSGISRTGGVMNLTERPVLGGNPGLNGTDRILSHHIRGERGISQGPQKISQHGSDDHCFVVPGYVLESGVRQTSE